MKTTQKQTANDCLVESLAFAGYSSPECALETWGWAFSKGDTPVMLQSATLDVQKELEKEMTSMTEDQFQRVGMTWSIK